jgi:hemoglobin-like flavoprotein
MDIAESIQWLLSAETIFGKLFYNTLFERHPELEKFFHDVDINQQAVLLTMQLSVIGQCYPHTLPAVDAYLQILGTKHKRRGIPREAYQPFRDVLLETLGRSFGPVWDDNLAAQWRDALDVATEKMLEGYEKDFHV